MKTIDRRTALTLLGGAIGGAAASGISTATADSHVNPGSYPDPNTVDGLYNIHRKLQFSFDDRLVYWYLRSMRYGLVNSAFTPLWDIHIGFLSVTEDTKDGFQARIMAAMFYTDIKSGQLLKEFDNPEKCCGGAGTYFMEHREIAEKIRASRLLDLNNTVSDAVLTQCPVCRFYIGFQVTDREVTHPIKILARAYGL